MTSRISQAAVREMVARLSAPKATPAYVVQETKKINRTATRDLLARLTGPRTNFMHANGRPAEVHRRNHLKISKKKEREMVDRLSAPKMRREKFNCLQREPAQARARLIHQPAQQLEQQMEHVQHHPFMKPADLGPVQIMMVQAISPTVEIIVITLVTSVFHVGFVALHVKEQLQIEQSPQFAHYTNIPRELFLSSFEAPEPVFFKMDQSADQVKTESPGSSIEARRERALKMHFYRHGILSLTQVNSTVPAFRAVSYARHPNHIVA